MRPPSRVSVQSILTPSTFKSLLKTSKFPVIPLDATWYLPNAGRIGKDEFLSERIPGARFFDIDEIKDPKSPYPHMLPSTEGFNQAMSNLGINKNDILVVYDKQGNFSAPRALWMLTVFQHPSVFLLDNYAQYKQESHEIDTTKLSTAEEANPCKTTYESPGELEDRVVTYSDLRQVIIEPLFRKKFNVIDARPHARWTGQAPEPRPGLPSGHIPDSISMPFNEVLVEGTNNYKTADELSDYFLSKGIDPDKPTIAMCGTGVTACVIETAFGKSGLLREDKPVIVYDGSWTEWAQRSDKKYIVTGEE
ncbi:Rhodanese-like domain-containing protein [Lipomyces arxii]|uniref:Rhodanese-like domain-containing protein n=1 Tax=Lipomyces arxii TaxID=56418 RepID=UPI0034CFE39F